ncbi:MAG: hypothetical protein ACXU86_12915 [Archangium sp.]
MFLWGALGVALGLPLGVWWGGEATGADGSLSSAMAGMAVGVGAGIVLPVLFKSDALLMAIPILALVGPIVGYELSLHQKPSRRVSLRPRLQPTLAFSSSGAMLGLGGSF